jgi:hypothetical protein
MLSLTLFGALCPELISALAIGLTLASISSKARPRAAEAVGTIAST